MSEIVLNINRKKALVGAALPYRIIINGEEVDKLMIGKSTSVKVPKQNTTLKISMVGNAINFHNIEKETVLFPECCKTGVINCTIITKINWIGYMTLGILRAMADVKIDIQYL